jgi:hypothetical protein
MVKKDWDEILLIPECRYNNSHYSNIGMILFYADFGQNTHCIRAINQMETCCSMNSLFVPTLKILMSFSRAI